MEADYKNLFEPLARARGVSLPSYQEALHNVSILFENSHHAIGTPKSLPLNVVEIGGYHIPEGVPKLPEDMQSILDRSTNGVVYFSMGSVLKSAHFSEDTRKGLLRIFGSLPYTVLWKFEEELKGVPENVHVRPWMPQSGILAPIFPLPAHPNTKVFVTHGGLLSTLEAIHFGVPLIAIPVFGDQPMNAARAARSGYALKVDYGDRMVEELRRALDSMLEDDSYYRQAKRLSGLFRRRPVSPQKLIVHYTELAIETGGAGHLRTRSALYPWYQRLLLDQLAFVVGLVVGVVFVVKRLVRLCRGGKRSVKIKKN
ncbi:UDP-glucuronosyltransferase 2B10 [Eumeta japonica]|uniref:UDP-glucuronosyltransferase 2B10 n=1 Tax=Eumeta variegata TaxID=151549 RepID=A0A4C1VIL7_EUMVA|nr:UDP-glucuronosyltransferase 2B10 [Eumeta japonica]